MLITSVAAIDTHAVQRLRIERIRCLILFCDHLPTPWHRFHPPVMLTYATLGVTFTRSAPHSLTTVVTIMAKSRLIREYKIVPLPLVPIQMTSRPLVAILATKWFQDISDGWSMCSQIISMASPSNGGGTDSFLVGSWSFSSCLQGCPESISKVLQHDIPVLIRGRPSFCTRTGSVVHRVRFLVSTSQIDECRWRTAHHTRHLAVSNTSLQKPHCAVTFVSRQTWHDGQQKSVRQGFPLAIVQVTWGDQKIT